MRRDTPKFYTSGYRPRVEPCWATSPPPVPAQAQKVKSAPFSYLPEQGTDRYDMRVPRKTLPLADGTGFVILAHQSSGSYAVERYDADLKKQWSTTIPINARRNAGSVRARHAAGAGGAAPQGR